MRINSIEIEKVSLLESFDRYKYFIKRIVDSEVLWTVVDIHGDYALSEVDGRIMIPFWSASEYVALNLNGKWHDCVSKKLSFDDLENEIFDLIANENYLINVFPLRNRTGFVVDLDEFARDLNEVLKRY